MIHIYIAHEINLCFYTQYAKFAFGSFLFGAAKLTKNIDSDQYFYSGYDIGFDARGKFSLPDVSGFGKNIIIVGADMSSPVHFDNKKKDILFLGKGPTDDLDDTTLIAKKKYSTNFTEKQNKFF